MPIATLFFDGLGVVVGTAEVVINGRLELVELLEVVDIVEKVGSVEVVELVADMADDELGVGWIQNSRLQNPPSSTSVRFPLASTIRSTNGAFVE